MRYNENVNPTGTGEKSIIFTEPDKSWVKIGKKEYAVEHGKWEPGPDPEHPDYCEFRAFQFKGINPEYTDGGEIHVINRTPAQCLVSDTVDWDAYQEGKLKLLLVIDGKLSIYHPTRRGQTTEIPRNSFCCWIAENYDTYNSVIEGTGPGYYSKLIPGNFALVPNRAANYNGQSIPPEFWEEIENADKRFEEWKKNGGTPTLLVKQEQPAIVK